jgi:hypothetical protein
MDCNYDFQDIFTTAGSADITPSSSFQEHFAPQTPQRQQPTSYHEAPFSPQAQQLFFDSNLNLSPADLNQTMFNSSTYQMPPAGRLRAMNAAQRPAFATQQNEQHSQPNQPRQAQHAPLPSSTPGFNTMAMHSPFASQQQRRGARQQAQSPSPYPTPPQSGNSRYGQRTQAPSPAVAFGSRAGAPRQNLNTSQGTLDTTFFGNNKASPNNMATPHMATPHMATSSSSTGNYENDEPFTENNTKIFMKYLHDRKERGEVNATQILEHLYAAGSKAEFESRIKKACYNEVLDRHRKVARMGPAGRQARMAEMRQIKAKSHVQQQKNAQFQQQKEAQARAIQQQREEQALQARRQKEAQEQRLKRQQEAVRAAEAEKYRKRQAALVEESRKRQAQEYQRRLEEEAEYHRVAHAKKLERERKLVRKEQLRKDPSALYRHYNEYLSYFPLERDQRRSNYHNNLLANRAMTADANTNLDLAIQFAKDHWQWYLVFPQDADSATTWQKEKLAIVAAPQQPVMAADVKAKGK